MHLESGGSRKFGRSSLAGAGSQEGMAPSDEVPRVQAASL